VNPRRLARALLAVAALPALLVTADGSATPTGASPMQPDAALLARARAGDAAAGATLFAADLLDALGRETPGNLVASPLSVYDALALLAPGARGATAEALQKALHSDLSSDALLLDMARLRQELSSDGATLHVAAAAWMEQSLAIRDAYRELLTGAGAAPRQVDFVRDAESARQAINAWIEANTAGRIAGMIPRGAVDDMTRLVLADAVALDAQWATRFLKSATAVQTFHVPGGDAAVETMHSTDLMAYASGAGWQAVRLPYKDGRLDALVVLPDPGVDPLAVLPAVTAPAARDAFSPTRVVLSLPRFELSSSVDLGRALAALGLGALFSRPDLSGIAGVPGELAVSRALHRALLSVDENGTRGAAATAMMVAVTSARVHRSQVEMTVDRPFLFVVEDSQHGVPVFVARVSDPR
jgi:serpin B